MMNLNLRPLIPLAAASALVAIGCGGKATDGVVGDGDGDGDQGPQTGGDPLSDENFNRNFDARATEYCSKAYTCGSEFNTESECLSFLSEIFERTYDTESRRCRTLTLQAFDCINDSWRGCYDYDDDCRELSGTLSDECAIYDYDY